jgi:hypothetical protein
MWPRGDYWHLRWVYYSPTGNISDLQTCIWTTYLYLLFVQMWPHLIDNSPPVSMWEVIYHMIARALTWSHLYCIWIPTTSIWGPDITVYIVHYEVVGVRIGHKWWGGGGVGVRRYIICLWRRRIWCQRRCIICCKHTYCYRHKWHDNATECSMHLFILIDLVQHEWYIMHLLLYIRWICVVSTTY